MCVLRGEINAVWKMYRRDCAARGRADGYARATLAMRGIMLVSRLTFREERSERSRENDLEERVEKFMENGAYNTVRNSFRTCARVFVYDGVHVFNISYLERIMNSRKLIIFCASFSRLQV